MEHNPVPGRHHIDLVESPYIFPNTANECSRLNLQHAIMQRYLQTNTIAPVGDPYQIATTSDSWGGLVASQYLQRARAASLRIPQRILDVGCGTGRWAIEMARQFPQSHITGIDVVEPARPYTDDQPLPLNCTFTRGNLLHGLSSFADGTFEYVHMRFVGLGIPSQQWPAVVTELARLTAPAGWIEIIEYMLPTNAGPNMMQASAILENALQERGIDPSRTRVMDYYMRQARYPVQAISNQIREMPLGAQGGALGRRMGWNLIVAFTNLQTYFLQTGAVTASAWEKVVQGIEREVDHSAYQPILPLSLTIGQRATEAKS